MEKAGGLRNCLELMRLWERKKIQIPGIDLWRVGPGAEGSCTPHFLIAVFCGAWSRSGGWGGGDHELKARLCYVANLVSGEKRN